MISLVIAATVAVSASGGTAEALAMQRPFAAREGFEASLTFRYDTSMRHPAGFVLMPEEDGPSLAVLESVNGFSVQVTDVRGGVSTYLERRHLPYALPDGTATVDVCVAYDPARDVVGFSLKGVASCEVAAPAGIRGVHYRMVLDRRGTVPQAGGETTNVGAYAL